jgi:uncharacterized membrane protein
MADEVTAVPAEPAKRLSAVPPALLEIAAGTPCVRCGSRIEGNYFVANGHVVCANCRESLEGSASAAVRWGIGAALVAAGVYYAVFAVWRMNFVLIAVIAGVLIGLAVRRGAQSNRAQRFRFVAVGLTYLCVVSTYLPALIAMPDVPDAFHAGLRALYLPFLMLISMKNPVTLILLGFGLHEAWKLSAPHVVNVDGPFQAVHATR